MRYHISISIVFCPDYGIPQRRKRLVLLASKLGDITLIPKTHTADRYVTVRDVIGELPPIQAGSADPNDPLHRARSLSALNLQRIRHTKIGGSWRDWPENMILDCFKRKSGKSYGSVYGRMKWDEPAPTMTTQCTGQFRYVRRQSSRLFHKHISFMKQKIVCIHLLFVAK